MFLTLIFLWSGLFYSIHAQSVIGIFSDTVYLLSVFHNSGEKYNRAENYYYAVFLDRYFSDNHPGISAITTHLS